MTVRVSRREKEKKKKDKGKKKPKSSPYHLIDPCPDPYAYTDRPLPTAHTVQPFRAW